jgi:hypothetical protein
LLGCCGGIPVALIFTVIIVLVAQTAATRAVSSPFTQSPIEYDDYARPFQLPDRAADRRPAPYAEEVGREGTDRRRREPDRRREADDDWRRRAEEEGWRPPPPRGPRRKRDPDGGPWTGR